MLDLLDQVLEFPLLKLVLYIQEVLAVLKLVLAAPLLLLLEHLLLHDILDFLVALRLVLSYFLLGYLSLQMELLAIRVVLRLDLPYLLLDYPSFQLEQLVMLVALEPDLPLASL